MEGVIPAFSVSPSRTSRERSQELYLLALPLLTRGSEVRKASSCCFRTLFQCLYSDNDRKHVQVS